MSYPDLQGQVQVVQAIKPQVVAASDTIDSNESGEANGGIDTKGFRYAVIVLNGGDVNALGTAVKVQATSNSDGSTGATDITGAAFAAIPADDTVYYGVVDTSSTARYLNVNLVNAATNTATCSVSVLLWASDDTRNFAPTATTFAVGGVYDA